MMDDRLIRAAEHWSQMEAPNGRPQWWMHPAIVRHVNRLVCGEAIDGQSAGFHRLIEAEAPKGGFPRAISVGSGVAAKEIALLSDGIVQHFDLFEISEARLRASKRLARRHGVFDRIDFHCANAFERAFPDGFDLVYWNSSLHHMFDAHAAVAWSYRNLKPGGCFAMDEFVGATRFQWTDAELDIASDIRASLSGQLMRDPGDPTRSLDGRVLRPDLDAFIAADPSEAADSANILGAVRAFFPEARITLTGGVVYSLALDQVLANFDDVKDAARLESLLQLDERLIEDGHVHQAIAIARKGRMAARGGKWRWWDALRRLAHRR